MELRDFDKEIFKIAQPLEHKDRIHIEGNTTSDPNCLTVNLIEGKKVGNVEQSTDRIFLQFELRFLLDVTHIYTLKSLDSDEIVDYDATIGWPPSVFFKKTLAPHRSFSITLEYIVEGSDRYIIVYVDSGGLKDVSIAKVKLAQGAGEKMLYVSAGADLEIVNVLSFLYELDEYKNQPIQPAE